MSIYRSYENPWALEDQLKDARQRLRENPEDEFIAQEVAELEDRVNFAWQDQEAEESDWW